MNGKIKKMLSAVSITLCATVGLSLPIDVVAATLPKSETQYSSFDNVVCGRDERISWYFN